MKSSVSGGTSTVCECSDGQQLPVTVAAKGKCDVSVETSTIGITTDPDCLGPCEPGTSVVLEGIVWSESNNGKCDCFVTMPTLALFMPGTSYS